MVARRNLTALVGTGLALAGVACGPAATTTGTAHGPGRLRASEERTLLNAPVLIGWKVPGETAGVRDGRVRISRSRTRRDAAALDRMPGTQLGEWDPVLPAVTARITQASTLQALVHDPDVDYVAPLWPAGDAGGPADALPRFPRPTEPPAHGGPEAGGDPLAVGCKDQTADLAIAGRDPVTGDVRPWSFASMGVTDAWRRGATGRGVSVAVIDTGVSPGNRQLQMPEFSHGLYAGRHVVNSGFNNWPGAVTNTPWGTCNHGNRIAGLIAAPRDGVSTEGVAPAADLITEYTHGSVVIGGGNVMSIVQGIRQARAMGARIFNLAFGNLPSSVFLDSQMRYLAAAIAYEYHRTDAPSVLFVGAAGTLACRPVDQVMFPANLPEVLAVAAVAADRVSVPTDADTGLPDSCTGPEVALAAVVGDGVETTGPDDGHVEVLGGSSAASALVSGLLALVWSAHPDWTADQVRRQLVASAPGSPVPGRGRGVPDVYRAVGGFTDLHVAGGGYTAPGKPVTLASRPVGDGPFTYRWSTGATTPTITVQAGPDGTQQTYSVTVQDGRDGTQRVATGEVEGLSTPPTPDPVDPCDLNRHIPRCREDRPAP